MDETPSITKDELEGFLTSFPKPVMLGVFQEGCPPCEEIKEKVDWGNERDDVVFAQLILDSKNPEDLAIAALLGVEGTPTLIGFCHGQEVDRVGTFDGIARLVADLQQCSVTPQEPPGRTGEGG